jgi:hypothetical protein
MGEVSTARAHKGIDAGFVETVALQEKENRRRWLSRISIRGGVEGIGGEM